MSFVGSLSAIYAFFGAHWRAREACSRDLLLKRQAIRLEKFLNGSASFVPAFRSYKGLPLTRWPVMDKATLMGNFSAYNRLGIITDDAWAFFDTGTAPKGYAIGASTGTSGNRGLYVISESERFRWLGVMLYYAIPDVFFRRHRVAIVLPINSRLYDAANDSRTLVLRFFDLSKGIEAQFHPLSEFRPTVIVAPPKFLRALADSDTIIAPERIFSAAEVLDNEDRSVIESRFSVCLREIYMATEGLFAVSCEKGSLHLLEDYVHFEFESVAGSDYLVSPIITDFSRSTQIMVRYQMNDLLELSNEPCACGRTHQVVKAVHGRNDDVFNLLGSDGSSVRVTPDVIRNAVVSRDRAISDFRVTQTGKNDVCLTLSPQNKEAVIPAIESLRSLFQTCGAAPNVTAEIADITPPATRKLRRVCVAYPADKA